MQISLKDFLKSTPLSVSAIAQMAGISRSFLYQLADGSAAITSDKERQHLERIQKAIHQLSAELNEIELVPVDVVRK